jgi:carboxymethylenebutenolidase
MALRDYLVGEIVQDTSDGRREALRRLGLLGLGVTGATALLAACSDDEAATSGTTAAPGATTGSGSSSETGAPTSEAPAPTATVAPSSAQAELISFEGPAGELQAALAEAKDPRGAVLVIHENRGLTPHFHDLVARLAADGYTSLCVDLLSRQGGTAALDDEGAAQAGLGQAAAGDLLADLMAGIDELERGHPAPRSAPSVSASAEAWSGRCSMPARPGCRRRPPSTARRRPTPTSPGPGRRCWPYTPSSTTG